MKTLKETNPAPETPKPKGSGKPKPQTPWPSKLVTIAGCLFLLLTFIVGHWFFAVAGGIKMAMMYSLANNGKLSGRANGNVYMRNGRIRGFTVPKLVRNTYTTFVRYNLTQLSQGYATLSASNQAAWRAFTYVHSDRFANEIRVSGKNAYVGVNQNIVNIGDPAGIYPIQTPIPFIGVTVPILTGLASSGGNVVLDYPFASGALAASTYLLIFATKNESPGINRPGKSSYRVIGALSAADFAHVGTNYESDLTTLLTTKYGAPVVGRNIFVSVLPIDINTGQNATAQIFKVTVA